MSIFKKLTALSVAGAGLVCLVKHTYDVMSEEDKTNTDEMIQKAKDSIGAGVSVAKDLASDFANRVVDQVLDIKDDLEFRYNEAMRDFEDEYDDFDDNMDDDMEDESESDEYFADKMDELSKMQKELNELKNKTEEYKEENISEDEKKKLMELEAEIQAIACKYGSEITYFSCVNRKDGKVSIIGCTCGEPVESKETSDEVVNSTEDSDKNQESVEDTVGESVDSDDNSDSATESTNSGSED